MGSCFVIMGFGEKTDFQSNPQRVLNLDRTYENIIKPAVEEAGHICIRADEIIHSTVIDKPMYDNLLSADLVIADLSTANVNAVVRARRSSRAAATTDHRAGGEQFQLSVRSQSSQHPEIRAPREGYRIHRGDARQGEAEGKDHDADGSPRCRQPGLSVHSRASARQPSKATAGGRRGLASALLCADRPEKLRRHCSRAFAPRRTASKRPKTGLAAGPFESSEDDAA